MLQPQINVAVELRREADVEPAIPSQERRIVSILLQSFLVHQKHRHPRPIFRVVPLLLNFVSRSINRRRIHLGPQRRSPRLQVVTINRARNRKRLKSVKDLIAIPFSLGRENGADRRQCQVAEQTASEIEYLKL